MTPESTTKLSRILNVCSFQRLDKIMCLLSSRESQAEPRSSPRRYKPIIQVTEEIDINDITFTTSSPIFDRSSSHKNVNYYNSIKPEGVNKGSAYGRLSDTAPSVFPHANYGAVGHGGKSYSTISPKVASTFKFKPYKVYKVQDGHDGFRPSPIAATEHEKPKTLIFEPPTTYSATRAADPSKQYSVNIVPFSSLHPLPKGPTRATSYIPHDNQNFVPSPTFSPSVVAQINNENSKKFSDHTETKPFSTETDSLDWVKPTKKPVHIKKYRKVHSNHNLQGSSKDFPVSSEKPEDHFKPSPLLKESPQESESFLSEISTLHKDGGSGNGLDGVADSLDLKTGERVEFQMYGMDGPQSYKFGFDTGKGNNRHFRFEERDNSGKVKGHYGYIDEEGKMRIMKYEADPITGFHAGPVEISPDDN